MFTRDDALDEFGARMIRQGRIIVNLSWLERATKAIPIGQIAYCVVWSLHPIHAPALDADLLAAIGDLRLVDTNAWHTEPEFVGLGEVRAAMSAAQRRLPLRLARRVQGLRSNAPSPQPDPAPVQTLGTGVLRISGTLDFSAVSVQR